MSDYRKKLLARIHIEKQKLGLTDEDYRFLLDDHFNVASSKDLGLTDLERFFYLLASMGTRKSGYTQDEYINILWVKLGKQGLIQDFSKSALMAWVLRQKGVERLEWLNVKEKSSVIEALKKWLERAQRNST